MIFQEANSLLIDYRKNHVWAFTWALFRLQRFRYNVRTFALRGHCVCGSASRRARQIVEGRGRKQIVSHFRGGSECGLTVIRFKTNYHHNRGCRHHSSVDLSVPSILTSQVQVPSSPSTLFSIYIHLCHVKKTKINKKRTGLAHLKTIITNKGLRDRRKSRLALKPRIANFWSFSWRRWMWTAIVIVCV